MGQTREKIDHLRSQSSSRIENEPNRCNFWSLLVGGAIELSNFFVKIIQDFSLDIREALHEMLSQCHLSSKACLKMCVDALLDNLRRYPQVRILFVTSVLDHKLFADFFSHRTGPVLLVHIGYISSCLLLRSNSTGSKVH